MSLIIKTATQDDLQTIGDIHAASYRLRGMSSAKEAEDAAALMARYFRENEAGILLAIDSAGQAIGFSAWERRRPLGEDGERLMVDALHTVPTPHCAGFHLVKEVVSRLAAPGETIMTIPETGRSQKLFGKHGFTWINPIYMARNAPRGKKRPG